MPFVDAHQPGMFCWFELATTDTAAAKAFYRELLGWTYNEFPMGPDKPPYIIALAGDRQAGAMYAMFEDQREGGRSPYWLPYVSVAGADDMAARIRTLGGTVMMDPFDVGEFGRMSFVQDPAGGNFAIWQPKQSPGSRIVNETGAMCWTELLARDVDGSERFYTSAFGWSSQKMSMGDQHYTVFASGETPAAGMMPIPPGPEHTASQSWMCYFQVADCDVAVEKTQALGGKVCVQAQTIPGIGRFAVLADPQGATLGILQPERR